MGEEKNKKDSLSRRKFILSAGALATGVLAAGSIVGCSTSATTAKAGTEKSTDAPPLPWKYNKLDVDKVRERGYKNYFKYGCAYAAFSSLLETLVEDTGYPWNTIPKDMFQYGVGGAYSWGTLCGALNGSLAIINLAAKDHAAIGNELIGWYTLFPFPSSKHESYCKVPKQITTIANSPLCHVSVSTWANAANARVNEKEKKDRCAKVSGDTAAHAAELLNAALEGKFKPTYVVPETFAECMHCHQSANSALDNEQGKFNCVLCHGDHRKKENKMIMK